MEKRISKKAKKFIKIVSIVLIVALGFMLKTAASAATLERTYVLRVSTGDRKSTRLNSSHLN